MDVIVPRIQQLSEALANQIAAGEVIERPASVVKELLENALDAGADVISIDIGLGGLNQIKISDNGRGIVQEDLHLSIAAHATSKITKLSDLYSISSMGFRGEALASIAAVSRMSISSKPLNQAHGMLLEAVGGSYRISPCARREGTTVEVADLFCNVPVRKKFLKSAQSEYLAIDAVVKRFALCEPKVAVTLRHNDKLMLDLPGVMSEKTRLLRIKKLLGSQFIERAVFLDVEHGKMRLSGWLSRFDLYRSQNDKQWMYVNQRMVKDKLLNHAVKRAYGEELPPGRFPLCLLYLTLPTADVDVNVHPTKHEVRFTEPRMVHDFIVSSLTDALNFQPQQKNLIGEVLPMPIIADYRPKPLCGELREGALQPEEWLVLNEEFVMVQINGESFLVEIKRFAEHRLRLFLENSEYPLQSRPLLVPVTFMIEPRYRKIFEQCQAKLLALGIQMDWIGEKQIVIRTLPICLPELDIKQLLCALPNIIPTDHELMKLVVSCQSFVGYHCSLETRNVLLDALKSQLSKRPLSIVGVVLLEKEACRRLVAESL